MKYLLTLRESLFVVAFWAAFYVVAFALTGNVAYLWLSLPMSAGGALLICGVRRRPRGTGRS